MKNFKNLPVGLIGTGLGLATLSNAYNTIGLSSVRHLAMFIGMFIWFMAFSKIVFHFSIVKEEYMGNTVTATLYATFSMLTMVLSSYIVTYLPFVGKALWLIAVFIQSSLIIMLFVLHIFKKRNIDVILPSWYVTLLGLLVSTAIGGAMGFENLQKVIVIYGFIMYFSTIGVVVYRLAKKDLPAPARFTKTILLAPISLVIVGYINVFEPNVNVVFFLYAIFIITMIYVLLQTKSFMQGGFVPGYAALTFPHAIAIIASLKVSGVLLGNNFESLGNIVYQFAGLQIFFTTAVILYTLQAFMRNFKSFS